MGRRAVILLSGGLDSATAAALARREGLALYGLTIRYGQVHACEIDAARRVAASLGFAEHVELDIDLRRFGGSSLVGDGAIPNSPVLQFSSSSVSSQVLLQKLFHPLERVHPSRVNQAVVHVIRKHDEFVVDVARAQELDQAGRLLE